MVDSTNGVLLSGLGNGTISSGSTDAVNGGQLYAAALGGLYHSVNDGGTPQANQLNDGATGLYAQADGIAASASGQQSVAAGYNSSAPGASSVAVGSGAQAVADGSVAIGSNSVASRKNTVSVGAAGSERQIVNVAAGTQSTDAVNVSQLSGVQGTLQTQINNLSSTTGLVAQDPVSGNITVAKNTNGSAVDLSGTNGARTVTGIKDGNLSAGSTDAVTGSQLATTNTNVTNLGTTVAGIDSRTTQNANDIKSVQGDITNVQGSVSNLSTQINSGAVGLVQQDAASHTITVAKNLDGATVDMTGTQGARTITGVAPGAVNASSKDAVNGSQLFGVSKSLASALGGGTSVGTDGSLSGTSFNVNGGKYSTLQDALSAAAQSGGGDNPYVAGFGSPTGANPAASATGFGSTAIGLGSVANVANTVSVGNAAAGLTRRITNVADGTGAQDAATWGQVQSYVSGQTASTASALSAQLSQVSEAVSNQGVQLASLADAAPSVDPSVAVAYDQNADGTPNHGSVTLGGPSATVPVALHNVANGTVNATSTDAVNGSQLYTTNSSLANLGNTVAGIGTRVTTVENTVDNITHQLNSTGVGLVQQDASTKAINVAAATGGNSINVAGTDGDRTISGVKDGQADDDAVNVKQLKDAGLIDSSGEALNAVVYDNSARNSITFGGLNATAPVILHNVAAGEISATSTDAVNGSELYNLQTRVDQNTTAIAKNTSDIASIGSGTHAASSAGANAGSSPGVAVGYNSAATGENASVLGQNATALGSYGTAIGNDSYAAGPKDTAIGGKAKVNADGSVAVGANATIAASATNSVAVGADTAVNATQGTAIGQGATVATSATGAVALGQGSVATDANAVSVGSVGNERRITNVAAGTQATDAANVGQLQNAVGGVQNWASQQFDQMNRTINNVAKDAYSGVAAAMAMPNLTPSGPGRTIIGAGVANYKNGSAVSAGVTYRSNGGNWLAGGAVSGTSSGDVGVRVQVGYEF